MFLSIHTREKIQDIIRRISINQEITFRERIFVENHTKNSSYILAWLKRAISQRRHGEQNQEGTSGIIQSFTLDSLELEIILILKMILLINDSHALLSGLEGTT